MINRIIEWSAHNRFLVVLFTLFALIAGVWALYWTPKDAIPDLSDVQVIVYSEWMGRSPNLVEDQVTYPIVTTMLAAPKVKYVRGVSDFGQSYVYVIFEDGTDLYWARSRVLEYLSGLTGKFPPGVSPRLGPDATALGWVYQYALVDASGTQDLASLRSFQDWYLRYWLQSVPGVAEVAAVGGFVKQYQVQLNPSALLAYNLPLGKVIEAVRKSNLDTGGRSIELAQREYMIRGRGYIRSLKDLEQIAVGTDGRGTPILMKDIARVQFGPDMRRGIAELNGQGETVGGIVLMRYGQDALAVIDAVKEKLREVAGSLPKGVSVVPVYDRSDLIYRAIDTLTEKLIEEILIVSLVCLLFLYHLRSALVAILILPIAIAISFLPMYYLGLTSNIMSLGGIAIAIGAMVDAAIVMIENAHKRLEHAPPDAPRLPILIEAAKEVGRPLFFSLLIITVSFLPVFTLEAQEGRLFKPLAFTKTFAMFFASLLSITLAPVLMVWLIKGRIVPEHRNPVNRALIRAYQPLVQWVLKRRWPTVLAAVVVLALTVPALWSLESEFMPPLNEGSLLYMPTSNPGLSVTEAARILQVQDRILKGFPEVESVFGKIGRANTPTDPAPLNMVETVVMLKPEQEWRKGMTFERLKSELNQALQIPGMPNIWQMPIETRIQMLSTGVRSTVGIKVYGPSFEEIHHVGQQIEAALRETPGTVSAVADRVVGGYFYDFAIRREEVARYGLTVADVQEIIEMAIGGENITTTVEGRERYPVSVRYAREHREDPERLARVLVPTPAGAQVPIGQLAEIKAVMGPPMINDENGSIAGFVQVGVAGRALGGYVEEAKRVIREKVHFPAGTYITWAGQYQFMERAMARLKIVVPLTILIIFLLLYFNFRRVAETWVVLLTVPFSVVGAVWFLKLLGYHLSVAVWVGIIALAGVAAEIGVVMLVYLNGAYERRVTEGTLRTADDLYEAIIEGSAKRVRPIMMTAAAIMAGLLPIMWSAGTGADVMKRIAAPMVGGMVTATVLSLLVLPAIYAIWKGRALGSQESEVRSQE